MIATFDVTQRLEASDNPGLDVDGTSDVFGRTVLGFGLESVTSIQSFRLNLGTDIEEFRDDNEDDLDFDNIFGTLNYTRATRAASVGAVLRYREADTDGEIADEDFDQDGNIISQTEGTRISAGYDLNGSFGNEAPFGGNFNWRYNEISFRDTDDDDSTLNQFSGALSFRVSPLATLSLTGRYADFDTEDPNGTDRLETGLGVAADLEVNPITTVNVGLSYDEIERRGGTDRDDDGGSLDIGVTRQMPDGSSLGARYNSDVFANSDGRRSFLSVNRNMPLPSGALSFSVGVTGADAVGTDPLIETDYRYDLPLGQITFGLSQRVVVDEDDDEDINTSLRAAYNQQINTLSSFGFNASVFDQNALSDDGGDTQRIEIGFNYRYELTRDWGLVSGITYTALSEDFEEDRDRTSVFVGLARSFQWNP